MMESMFEGWNFTYHGAGRALALCFVLNFRSAS